MKKEIQLTRINTNMKTETDSETTTTHSSNGLLSPRLSLSSSTTYENESHQDHHFTSNTQTNIEVSLGAKIFCNLDELPDCLYWEIFSFLDFKTLCLICNISTRFKRCASVDRIWKTLFKFDEMENWASKPSVGSPLNLSNSNNEDESWKDFYQISFRIKKNWNTGNIQVNHMEFEKSEPNEGKYMSPVDIEAHPTIRNSIIVGSTHSGVVKILNQKGEISKYWIAHPERFHGISLDPHANDNHLCTWRQRSTTDDFGACRVWDLSTGKRLVEQKFGRGESFYHPRYCNMRFSFWDRQERVIIVYDLKSNDLVLRVSHSTHPNMDLSPHYLVEAPNDYSANVWDLETKKVIHKLYPPNNTNQMIGQLTVSSESHCVGCSQFDLSVWSLKEGTLLHHFQFEKLFSPNSLVRYEHHECPSLGEIQSVVIHKNLLVVISSLGDGHVFDMNSGKRLWGFQSDADTFVCHDTRILAIKRHSAGHLCNLEEYDFENSN